ncbi:MAG TPA: hypothetical protein VIV11_39500 [Kofleriaceae bacterium]
MRLAPTILLISSLPACATPPLEERLDEPDVAIPADCAAGATEIEVNGTVTDFATGEPVAGATIDITEAWASTRSFPTNGCRIGTTTTDATGKFGPLRVNALDSSPILAFLVTGAGRAHTIHDKSVGCLLGCYVPSQDIVSPSQELVDEWREELFAGGMEYALNRGLVVYRYHDVEGNPAPGVTPVYERNALSDDDRALRPGSEVRFIDVDRQTLADIDQRRTLGAGAALIGGTPDAKGYFRVAGERGADRWPSLGVIAATGWIYFESDSLTAQ